MSKKKKSNTKEHVKNVLLSLFFTAAIFGIIYLLSSTLNSVATIQALIKQHMVVIIISFFALFGIMLARDYI